MLSAAATPAPSKNDKTEVVFSFEQALTLPKATPRILMLTCDITKIPEGPATYIWRLGGSLSSKTMLISEGSFVLEVADSSPASRQVPGGAKGEVLAVFDFYAAGEAVELKTIAFQVDGNARALSAYTLWDGTKQVGGGVLKGESVFKATFSDSFIVSKDAHKLLTVKADIASGADGSVSINFNGNDNNFHLTYGIGISSGRGIIPSTQSDTHAPSVAITTNAQ